jgi:competence protein ComEC
LRFCVADTAQLCCNEQQLWSARRALTTQMQHPPNPDLWARTGQRLALLEFRRAPLLAAAVWFALGELAGRNGRPVVFLVVGLILLVGLVVISLRRTLRIAAVPLAGVWMVVGMWSASVQPMPERQTQLLHFADGLSRTVRGKVVRVRVLPSRVAGEQDLDKDSDRMPVQEVGSPAALSVDVQVDAVEEVTPDVSRMVDATGGVRLTLMARGDALPALQCGDVVEAPMQLRIPERYNDPGAWQYADYLLAQGIGVHANVRAQKFTKIAVGDAGLQCSLFAAQSWAAMRMDGYIQSVANRRLPVLLRLSKDDAGMLKAMMFGDRAGLTQTQRIGFQRTGSFHLFVVSGLHVTLLAGAVFWLARRLRLREWLGTLMTLALATGYAIVTGFGAPVQRALWMTAIFLVARLLSRERSALNGLGAAALGVLVWSPSSLFESSFQMTFLAVMAIAGIAVPLGERSFVAYARAARGLDDAWIDQTLTPRVAQLRVMLRLWGEALAAVFGRWAYGVPAMAVRWTLWAAELAMIGAVVEMVMVLPMAVYFHRATPFALPANMLSVPMVAVLAPLGVMTFVASLVSPWVAALPGATTALLLHGVVATVGAMSHIRVADVRVPAPAAWVMVVAVATWAFCCWAVRWRARLVVGSVGVWGVGLRSVGAWCALALLPLVAGLVLWPERPLLSAGVMEVTAIDVGQGDSLLIVSPEGQTMLVDAGGPVGSLKETAEAQATFDVGEEVVSPYLWSRQIRRLDVIALSHAHSDHMGGMAAVMRNMRPRELWVGVDADSAAYRALLAEAAELGVVVRHYRAEDAVIWSGVDVRVLSPGFDYANPGDPKNDDSLVLRLQYGKSSVLLEGDAEAASERTMVANGLVVPVTLLKVGHHGSRTSTTAEFFAAAAPQSAVVSVGKGNTFGHPRYEVIERIADAHTKLYRTDEFGLTTFLLGRDGVVKVAFPRSPSE